MAFPAPNIDDKFPLLATAPVRWRLMTGVMPVIETFDVLPGDVDQLRKRSETKQPVTLNINGVQIKNLWILEVAPADGPFTARIKIADRRWFWSRGHILRRYNIRRNIGHRAISNNQDFGLQTVVRKIWYARYSLKNRKAVPPGGKWKAQTMLRDAIKLALEVEAEFTGAAAPEPKFLGEIESMNRTLSIENLVLDDPANLSVNRALNYVPEAALFIDLEGDVIVFSRSNAGEIDEIKKLADIDAKGKIFGHIVGKGHAEVVSNSITRPQAVDVLFTRKIEVRFDFGERTSFSDTQTRATGVIDEAASDEGRFMQNVLPIPDHFLTIKGKDLPQGTWITFDEAFRAWNDLLPAGIRRIDHPLVQRAFIPYLNLWSMFLLQGLRDPDADWAARIAAIQQHYRRTFRINQQWIDRILSIEAYRVATTDQSTGSRAPAPAYSDYCIIPGVRTFLAKGVTDSNNSFEAMNVTGFPANGNLDVNTKAAPAQVIILDEDQGIISINYQIDPYRMYEMILPSKIQDDFGLPKADIRARGRSFINDPICFDEIRRSDRKTVRLEPNHRVAIIVTCIPASPNNEAQLHRIRIFPKDVKRLIPQTQQAGLDKAFGPIKEIRVGLGVETARVRWHDSDRAKGAIELAFGINNDSEEGKSPDLSGMVINEGEQQGVGTDAASLNAIARAYAAREYASLVDRYEGEITGRLNKDVKPSGWVEEVTHELAQDGALTTRISLPEKIEQMDLFSLLPASTRAIILKEAKPGK